MSLIYICDCCKSPIDKEANRRAVQVVLPATNKKLLYHACSSCYDKYVYPAISGSFIPKQEVVEDTEEYSVLPTQSWDEPRTSRESKYFNLEVCYGIHRLIIAGAKPVSISERYNIPYQVTRNYVNTFDQKPVVFEPTVPIDMMQRILNEHGSKLIKVRTLLATCTWSLKDIAGDTGIELDDVKLFWNNLPWFVDNLKYVKEVRVDIDGEDTDN